MTRNVTRRTAHGWLLGGPLLVGAWLFLAAVPVFADAGPHVKDANSGVSTLTADGCAGCHRAHTAQGEMLINAPSEEELCLTCHGAASTGSSVDVMTGVQYALGTNGLRDPATALGAVRGGGFDQARLASSTPARRFQTGSALSPWSKVSVGSAADVTSSHLNLAQNALTAPAVAWGNNGINTGAGPTVTMSCAACHNPHGNGNYRILNPIPAPTGVVSGTFTEVVAPGAVVTDAALPAAGDTRNYTVLQVKGTFGSPSTFLLYASEVEAAALSGNFNGIAGNYGPTGGDYWRVRVPWNNATGGPDAPNGIPGGLTPFNTQMETWCTACHTRYHTEAGGPIDNTGDTIFRFKHQTTGRTTCTTCHVTHGSNARMAGAFSASQPFPDGTSVVYDIGGTTGDSRLLKVDNRGTCQLCHDPTGTVLANTYTGPATVPGVP